MHFLICGVTLCGKTTLAHKIARDLDMQKDGPEIIVYDPMLTPTKEGTWPQSAELFDNKEKFLRWLHYIPKSEKGYAIFVDEADSIFSHEQKENFWILTKGRHKGFQVFVITQRPKMISPSVRSQCGVAYVFRLSRDDLKNVGNDYAHEISHIDLDRGDFLELESGLRHFRRGRVL